MSLASVNADSQPADAAEAVETVSRPQRRPRRDSRSRDAAILTASLAVIAAAWLLAIGGGGERVAAFGYTLPELCLSRAWFDMRCPGCGLTRSFVSLAHGQWSAAWGFHPLGPVLFGLAVVQPPYRVWRLGFRPKRA